VGKHPEVEALSLERVNHDMPNVIQKMVIMCTSSMRVCEKLSALRRRIAKKTCTGNLTRFQRTGMGHRLSANQVAQPDRARENRKRICAVPRNPTRLANQTRSIIIGIKVGWGRCSSIGIPETLGRSASMLFSRFLLYLHF
jgi:hypothetical protein